MHKRAILFLILSTAAGICGFFLRRYELATAFEPGSMLAIQGAPASILLCCFSVLFMIIITIFSLFVSTRENSSEGFDKAFGTHTLFYPLTFVLITIAWNCGTTTYLFGARATGPLQVFDYCFVIMSLLAAVCKCLFAICIYLKPRSKLTYPLYVIPIIFMCLWLVAIYRQNAANPVMLSYIYHCLAIILSTLSFYYIAGYLYGKPSPGKTVLSCCGTVYFCVVSSADNHGPGISIILLALAANAAVHLFLLLYNLKKTDNPDIPEVTPFHENPYIENSENQL